MTRLALVIALVMGTGCKRTAPPEAHVADAAPAAAAASSDPKAAAAAYVEAIEHVADVHDKTPCASLQAEVDRARPSADAGDDLYRTIDEDPALHARMRAAMNRVMRKRMDCARD
jgi:hypothetical protein